jgi:hypothetical protein
VRMLIGRAVTGLLRRGIDIEMPASPAVPGTTRAAGLSATADQGGTGR